MPAPMTASPEAVGPGHATTVSAPAVDCDLGYGSGTTYRLALMPTQPPPGYRYPIQLAHYVDADVAPDGSFRAEVTVPKDFPSGRAEIHVEAGSPFNDCPPTVDCASYQVPLTVT